MLAKKREFARKKNSVQKNYWPKKLLPKKLLPKKLFAKTIGKKMPELFPERKEFRHDASILKRWNF